MKATALLEKQHRKVESLFKALETGKRESVPETLEQLADNLVAHAVIEEEMFYPLAKKVQRDLVLESLQEHEMATYALKKLMAAKPDSESFMAKAAVAKETVFHHVKEEEEEMFPAMIQSLGDDEDEALGKRMEARFKELLEAGYESALAARKTRRTENGQRARQTRKKASEHAAAKG